MVYHFTDIEALMNYGNGEVIVQADSLEQAKQKAYDAVLKEYYNHKIIFNFDEPQQDIDESCMEDYDLDEFIRVKVQLKEDLKREPLIDEEVICLWGSD